MAPLPPIEQPTESSVLRFGLTEVSKPPSQCNVDLVFVHGMNGDPQKTWTSKESGAFWPRDLLPSFVEEQKARVLVYGYDADITSLGAPGVTKDKIHNHAERLVADLFANRRIRKATERPIIFVAHSLGGLVVKRALVTSSEISGAKTEHLRSIYVSTYGILFLGTPHKGSDLAKWGSYLSALCQTVIPSRLASTESQLVDALKANSETLLNIDRQFAQLMDDFHIFFFHEAKPTNLKGALQYIVDEESAAPTLPDVERAGIQADHSHMCKFENVNAPGFDLVVDGIQRYSDDAPGIIRNRWVMEKRERLTRAVRKAKEIYPVALSGITPGDTIVSGFSSQDLSPGQSIIEIDAQSERVPPSQVGESTSSLPQGNKPTEPFFIVPPGFRANTFFVGMEKEMHELDRKLFDSRRRDGTACVLLHGQPGAGKTHVARQYVYKNRYKFQGGVFWLNAHLIDEVYKDFWQIHQKIVAKLSPEKVHDSSKDLGRNFVDEVREWFCDREEWLIVFDGVSVEHDKDVEELQRCIPDSSNSAIIYVSRSRRLETMQRLLRPHAIKINGLKEEDARDLLFKEIGIKHPRPAQIKSANTLAKKVGGLPLAISAIARRLADTHEPIEKFNIKSYSDDPKLGGTYHHIMSDLQKNGHTEAINLMNILCFFGPHIPVEMIRLGLRSLINEGVTVKASEEGVHPDINVTFGILMRHALIERNEPEDDESMSSGRDSFVEPEPIDILNLHAVIQRYWCDSLHTGKQLQIWLARAVHLLVYSFREADQRIRNQPKPGRLSDYRWYLIHARRLRDHTVDYGSKQNPLMSIRADLDDTIEKLQEEIHTREPSSSQESFSQVEFQTSIFDRTSSTSSTEPSQTNLDLRRRAPLSRLDTDDFENAVLDDSPVEIEQFGHVGQTVAYPAAFQFPILYSYPMQRDTSGSTIKPDSPSTHAVAPAAGGVDETRSSRPRVAPRRADSFRSVSAMPLIDRGHAQGMFSNHLLPHQHNAAPNTSNALSYLNRLGPRRLPLNGETVSVVGGVRGKPTSSNQPTTVGPAFAFVLADHELEQSHRRQSAPSSDIEAPQLTDDLQNRRSRSAHPSASPSSLGSPQVVDQEALVMKRTIDNSPTVTVVNGTQFQQPSVISTSSVVVSQDLGLGLQGTAPQLLIRPLNEPRTRRSSGTTPQASPRPPTLRDASPRSDDTTPRVSSQEAPGRSSSVVPSAQPTSTLEQKPRSSSSSLKALGEPPFRRVRSVSPLPLSSNQPYSLPLPPRPFLTPAIDDRYFTTTTAVDSTSSGLSRPMSNRTQQTIHYPYTTVMHAPYSDPLPTITFHPDNGVDSTNAHVPGQRVQLEGLGIVRGNDIYSRRDQPEFSTRWLVDQMGGESWQPPLADRGLNSLDDLTDFKTTEEFVGIPQVSFAPPSTSNYVHRRVGTAVDSYERNWLQKQQAMLQQQQQQQQQRGLAPQHSTQAFPDQFMGGNITHEPIIAHLSGERWTPNRNSAPYPVMSPLAGANTDENDSGVGRSRSGRRRTLSAPESPGWGPGTEHNLWSS